MKVGFIGVGNMGGPMCRNIVKRSNHHVTVFDLNAAAVRSCTCSATVRKWARNSHCITIYVGVGKR